MIFKRNELTRLKKQVVELARIINAPNYLMPTFGFSEQSGLPHIEMEGDIYNWVVCERGSEFERRRTTDLKEILFWIFESITFSMACDLELRNRRESEDFRIQLFQIQEEIISKIDEDYAITLKVKHDKLLS